jgi:hypothetical protein
MSADARRTYAPLDTLKPIAQDVWIADGPLIGFGPPLLKIDFPTRMSIVRVHGDALFVHSPTRLTAELRAQVERLGQVRWLVGPNRIHYWWLPDWKQAWPDAQAWVAEGVHERAGGRIDFATRDLGRHPGDTRYPWSPAIDTLPITGSRMGEVVFFHPASRTLLLTDFIENFEPARLPRWQRWLTRLGAAQDPDGQMPRDMRLVYPRETLRAAVRQMIAWNPRQVVLAHGRWYPDRGADELRRAFRWLL